MLQNTQFFESTKLEDVNVEEGDRCTDECADSLWGMRKGLLNCR